ncbi:DUF924 family protein [Breoghania sp. L-A4]|uniref:DUF924 family protein n=1 Tax=Breoghania sp. L-A4 TaxID=2304600 RepID=UPI000E35C051|nr:DUF924 family protein [Breoghania sp. L-A4]AXS38871.1 DUF924 domain-containing protein [Breoghania sp. L-A4]
MQHPDPLDILDFWWRAGPAKWFARSDEFDADLRARFLDSHERAAAGDLDGWAETPHGMLALILHLDQLPRNLFREDSRAFAMDARALDLAALSLERGFHRAFPSVARAFFFLPFEHAEDMAAQERSVDLFRQNGEQETYFYALVHMDVIRRFGRFPHRNKVLGRTTTAAEQAFLDSGGFGA